MNSLTTVERLKNELDTLRPLDNEAEARIMQKFRLDWNYHSNNLEGNSLTYGETKALILFGITAQGKPLKDHFEITGHNEAINWILEIVKDEAPLTEKFIRELHTLLLKESSYKEAQTLNGKPTRRKIEVGKYKTQPNHVVTVTGDTFYFATPEETPAKMQELIDWFRNEKEKPDVNPIILAALFHYRFIRIHPFDDGNGRVARILMNFILMQFGYPPVIIKTEDKENYYAVLRLADAGEREPFIEYITENLIRSLEIMIRGAKGESIEEPEDLDKEILLLKKSLERTGARIELQMSREIVYQIFTESFIPLAKKFVELNAKFDDFYLSTSITFTLNTSKGIQSFKKEKKDFDAGISQVNHQLKDYADLFVYDLAIIYKYYHFNQSNVEDFSYSSKINFKFEPRNYLVQGDKVNLFYKRFYSESLMKDEAQNICDTNAKKHLEYIKKQLKENEQEF